MTWWSPARLLSKIHRVIVPDLLWFGASDSVATPGLDAQVEAVAALVDIEAGRERYAGLAPAEHENSLVIWGEHDRGFPVATGRQLSELLGAEFLVIDGTAHAPHIERPRQVNGALVKFLETGLVAD